MPAINIVCLAINFAYSIGWFGAKGQVKIFSYWWEESVILILLLGTLFLALSTCRCRGFEWLEVKVAHALHQEYLIFTGILYLRLVKVWIMFMFAINILAWLTINLRLAFFSFLIWRKWPGKNMQICQTMVDDGSTSVYLTNQIRNQHFTCCLNVGRYTKGIGDLLPEKLFDSMGTCRWQTFLNNPKIRTAYMLYIKSI